MIEKRQCQSNIGKRLKQLRQDNHITQQQLADYLYVSVDSIYGYEKGRVAIGHDQIEKLCVRFNVSADYFYFERDRKLNEEDSSDMWSDYYNKLNDEERTRALEILRLAFPKVRK